MAERCLTLGCPEAVRLALQDPCTGAPIPGLCNGAVLTCLRNWTIEPIVEEGEASDFKSDCGSMVVRDKQDDQQLGYTISFETSKRSTELDALVTGGEVIPSGGLNIGSYKVASNLACDTPSEDPRFIIEVFYKLSRCVTGADHVRWVLPLGQFKVTEIDTEGSIAFYRYTAETGIALANAFGAGPYADFPADVTAFLAGRDPDELTAGFDFEEIVTITGSCGCVEVPETEIVPLITGVADACADDGTGLTFTGTNLDLVDGWFEVSTTCGVLRGYISTSTNQQGEPATSESATEVVIIDDSVVCGPCTTTGDAIIYDSLGVPIGDPFVIDPAIDLCCEFTGFNILESPAENDGMEWARDIAVDSLGRFVANADNGVLSGGTQGRIIRFDTDGQVDLTFGTAGFVTLPGFTATAIVGSIAVDSNDNILVTYTINMDDLDATMVAYLARYDSTGTLDATFGTGGIVTLATDAVAVTNSHLAIESTDDIVVGWNQHTFTTIHEQHGRLERLSGVDGTSLDIVYFDTDIAPDYGAESITRIADGDYIVLSVESQTGNARISRIDLDTTTVVDSQPFTAIFRNGVDWGTAYDGTYLFVSGREPTNTFGAVARMTGANLTTLDATFGVAGVVTFDSTFDAALTINSNAASVYVIAGNDLIFTGTNNNGLGSDLLIIRTDNDGNKTYAVVNSIGTVDTNSFNAVNDGTYATLIGYSFDGVNFEPMIAQMLDSNGSFNTAFGDA